MQCLPLQEVWAEGGMNHCHCCIWYLGQVLWYAVWKLEVQKHFWLTPLTRISIDVADSSVLPLLFLRSLSVMSGCHIINVCGGHQDMKLRLIGPMAYHPHTGFYYCKLLTCLMTMAALAIFQTWIWVGFGIGKFLFDYVLKKFLPWKWMFWVHACIWLTAWYIVLP